MHQHGGTGGESPVRRSRRAYSHCTSRNDRLHTRSATARLPAPTDAKVLPSPLEPDSSPHPQVTRVWLNLLALSSVASTAAGAPEAQPAAPRGTVQTQKAEPARTAAAEQGYVKETKDRQSMHGRVRLSLPWAHARSTVRPRIVYQSLRGSHYSTAPGPGPRATHLHLRHPNSRRPPSFITVPTCETAAWAAAPLPQPPPLRRCTKDATCTGLSTSPSRAIPRSCRKAGGMWGGACAPQAAAAPFCGLN